MRSLPLAPKPRPSAWSAADGSVLWAPENGAAEASRRSTQDTSGSAQRRSASWVPGRRSSISCSITCLSGPRIRGVASVPRCCGACSRKHGRFISRSRSRTRVANVSRLVATRSHVTILKRSGIVLLGIGLLDIAVRVDCIVHRVSYPSRLDVFAVVAGLFWLRGSLRAAAVVRWSSTFMPAGFAAVVLARPLMRPMALTLTQVRPGPLPSLTSRAVMAFVRCLLQELCRALGKAPVRSARPCRAVHSRRTARWG